MRSSPLLLLLLVMLGFAAAAVPLARLTQARPRAALAPSPPAAGAEVNTLIRLRFAHQPVRISLKQGDRVLATVTTPGDNPVELASPVELGDEGVELMIDATWPAGTPATALTLELEPDGIEARSATRWTDTAALAAVISFSWR